MPITVSQQHELGTRMRGNRNVIEIVIPGWSSESVALGLSVVIRAIAEHGLSIPGQLGSGQPLVEVHQGIDSTFLTFVVMYPTDGNAALEALSAAAYQLSP